MIRAEWTSACEEHISSTSQYATTSEGLCRPIRFDLPATIHNNRSLEMDGEAYDDESEIRRLCPFLTPRGYINRHPKSVIFLTFVF